MASNDIRTSLHGNRIGLDTSDNLVINGRRALNNPQTTAKRVNLFDDFLGDVIADQWHSSTGSDGQVVAPAVLASEAGGAVRMTTGDDAAASMAVNGVLLDSYLNYMASKDNLVFETRVKLSAITNISFFAGFTDQASALEMPINASGSGNGVTTNATDAVGFMFDTSMTDDYFWCTGVKNDTDATQVVAASSSGSIAPVADTYVLLRIEVDSSGNATFYINGDKVGYVASAVTASVALTPVVAAFTRSAASANVTVDYVSCGQDR